MERMKTSMMRKTMPRETMVLMNSLAFWFMDIISSLVFCWRFSRLTAASSVNWSWESEENILKATRIDRTKTAFQRNIFRKRFSVRDDFRAATMVLLYWRGFMGFLCFLSHGSVVKALCRNEIGRA